MSEKAFACIQNVFEECFDLSEKNVGKETVLEKTLDKTEKIVYSCISLDPNQSDALCKSLQMKIDEL